VKRKIKTVLTSGQRFASVFIMIITLFAVNDLFSRNVQSKATRQSSLEAFNKGDYESAYRQFSELLVTFPKDPLYKYYSGVCLVKMQKDPENAVTLLTGATKDGAVVRTIPPDALFWLGRAQQLAGRFDDAVRSFNDFTSQSGRKAARELGVQGYLQQCADKKGQLSGAELLKDIPGKETKSGVKQSVDAPAQQKGGDPAGKPSVNKPVKGDVDKILSEALEYQFKADSAEKVGGDQKNNHAILYQKQADQKITEAQAVLKKDSVVAVKSVSQQAKATVKTAGDSVKPADIKTTDETKSAAIVKPAPEKKITVQASQPEGVLSLFRVDPKPVYAPGEKIQINPKQPPGLIYRIQVGVFRNPVIPSHFKGITPVYGIKNQGATITTYYVGMFRRIADAKKVVSVVRQKGFKDAFIVAFSGGKVVSSERAALLEKEWTNIPFIADTKYMPEATIDTIPPALSFRVEIIRTDRPVSEENYEGMKKLSGTRSLDIETLPDGNISYLIGSFITYESAEEYADLLRRNGYRDSKVVAWLGKKEIPVETARQLFEKIE